MSKIVELREIKIGGNNPLVLIAGPCIIENEDMALSIGAKIKEITGKLNIPYIFKSSYKKANRTNIGSFTGLSRDKAFGIFEKIKKELDLPLLTDIHTEQEAGEVADLVDVIQIPAFLCRQTDLLVAAGKTNKIINIKKGQFLAPGDMKHAAEKVETTGNKNILFTERGTTFGYQNLVVDMCGIKIMKDLGYPVVMDATHSVQMPGTGTITGGNPQFIEPLARAAVAVGIDALFLEVHPDPKNALSDAASQFRLDQLEELLFRIKTLDTVVKSL